MVNQLNLFHHQPSLNVIRPLKESLSEVAKGSGLSRDEILDLMNELADMYGIRLTKGNGRALTMATLEKWLNPKNKEHIPGINALLVFCSALHNNQPIQVLLAPLGAQLIAEDDIKMLTWARHYHRAKKARQQMRKIEADL